MKRGCMQRNSRKEGPDVWQFRWSETRLDGKRLYHKKIVGTVEQYPDEDAARRSEGHEFRYPSTDRVAPASAERAAGPSPESACVDRLRCDTEQILGRSSVAEPNAPVGCAMVVAPRPAPMTG